MANQRSRPGAFRCITFILLICVALHPTAAAADPPACPDGPKTAEQATLFNVACNDTDVTVWTSLPVKLSSLVVPSKSLTVYGYQVTLDSVELKGGNLTVIAPYITCGGAISVTLSTQGIAAPERYQPGQKGIIDDPTCKTPPLGSQGCPGVLGNSSVVPGSRGGNIAIYADTLDCNQTALSLVTAGGKGQRGQDGGDGNTGAPGQAGVVFDCSACDDTANPECFQPYPLLTYNKDDIHVNGYGCASYYDPRSGKDIPPYSIGRTGGQGGLPGLPGNSTVGGSGGSIIFSVKQASISLLQTNLSAGSTDIAVQGRPGEGGIGGQGGGGKRSADYKTYASSQRYECIDDDEACRAPPGPSGAPGCTNGTESDPQRCSRFPLASIIGTPPSNGVFKNATVAMLEGMLAQPQLEMIALVADTEYFNQNFDNAAQAYAFLQRACNSSGTSVLPKCPAIEERSKQMLSQMLNGVNFYGQPASYVPLVGLTALQTYIEGPSGNAGLLGNLQVLENAYGVYWRQDTSNAEKTAQLRSSIAQDTLRIKLLNQGRSDILIKQNSTFQEFQILRGRRTQLYSDLNNAGEAFKAAVVKDLEAHPTFGELLYTFTTIGVDVASELALGVSVTANVDKLYPGEANKELRQRRNVIPALSYGTTFISDREKDLFQPASQLKAENDEAEDARKISVSGPNFQQFLDKYKNNAPAEYNEYKKIMDLFAKACTATTAKVWQYTALSNQYDQLSSQIDAANADKSNISDQEAAYQTNPAAVDFANYIAKAYKNAQQAVISAIYQEYQVYKYAFLDPDKKPSFANSKDFSALQSAQTQLKTDIFTALSLQGSNFEDVNNLSDYILQEPAFNLSSLLSGNPVTFYISGNDPAFKQLGSPTVYSRDLKPYLYTHNARTTLYEYNVADPSMPPYVPGSLGGEGSSQQFGTQSDAFVGLSPFSWWTIDLSGNDNIDFSKVTRIGLSFSGKAQAVNIPSILGSQPLQSSIKSSQPLSSSCERFIGRNMTLSINLPAAIASSSDLSYLLDDAGELRFTLPDLDGTVTFYTKPSVALPGPIGGMKTRIGSADFRHVGNNTYTASMWIGEALLALLNLPHPSLSGQFDVSADVLFRDPSLADLAIAFEDVTNSIRIICQ